MNSWGNEHFAMHPNMMGMPPMNPMVQNMMHPPLLPPPIIQNMMELPMANNNMPQMPPIGPQLPPEGMPPQPDVQDPSVESTEVPVIEGEEAQHGTSRQNQDGAQRSRDRNRDRDRGKTLSECPQDSKLFIYQISFNFFQYVVSEPN